MLSIKSGDAQEGFFGCKAQNFFENRHNGSTGETEERSTVTARFHFGWLPGRRKGFSYILWVVHTARSSVPSYWCGVYIRYLKWPSGASHSEHQPQPPRLRRLPHEYHHCPVLPGNKASTPYAGQLAGGFESHTRSGTNLKEPVVYWGHRKTELSIGNGPIDSDIGTSRSEVMVVIERKRRKSDERQKTGERGVKRTLRSRTFHPQSIIAYASDFSLLASWLAPAGCFGRDWSWRLLTIAFAQGKVTVWLSGSMSRDPSLLCSHNIDIHISASNS